MEHKLKGEQEGEEMNMKVTKVNLTKDSNMNVGNPKYIYAYQI